MRYNYIGDFMENLIGRAAAALTAVFLTVPGVRFYAPEPPRAIQSAPPACESEPLPLCDIVIPDRLSAPTSPEPTSEPARESSRDIRKVVPLPASVYTTYGMMEHFRSEAERLRKMLPEDAAERVDKELKSVYEEIELEYSDVGDDGVRYYGSIVGPLKAEARAKAYEDALAELD